MLAVYFTFLLWVWMGVSGFTSNYAEALSGSSIVLIFWSATVFFVRLAGWRPRETPDLVFWAVLFLCGQALHHGVVFESNQAPLWRLWLLAPTMMVLLAALCCRSYLLTRQSSS